MPGSEERRPADAERPPASRVGDELQQQVEDLTSDDHDPSASEMSAAEERAGEAAKDKQWDQKSTERERRAG